jgi:hypothetical protein
LLLSETSDGSRPPQLAVAALRERAAAGRLAALDPEDVAELRSAAYTVVWPLVWQRHTRRIEFGKGHPACASSLSGMAGACLDRFHDDVEAVVDYLFAGGSRQIDNLEGWITSRIAMATVDGYRKRRGQRGALQRVRVPGWLATALANDRELVELAGSIIEWVGLPGTAGTELWPLQVWADRRAVRNAGPTGARVEQVAADVEQVLATMRRTRPDWYASYIEGPIGQKQVSLVVVPVDEREGPDAARQRAERSDAELVGLAAAATDAISTALAAGEDPASAVPRILRAVFLGGPPADPAIDVAPGDEPVDGVERLATLLANEAALARLIDAVLEIVRESDDRLDDVGRS